MTAGMNRSEFFRAAGLRLALEVEGAGLTYQIDTHLSRLPAADVEEDLAHVTRRGRARLESLTDGEVW